VIDSKLSVIFTADVTSVVLRVFLMFTNRC